MTRQIHQQEKFDVIHSAHHLYVSLYLPYEVWQHVPLLLGQPQGHLKLVEVQEDLAVPVQDVVLQPHSSGQLIVPALGGKLQSRRQNTTASWGKISNCHSVESVMNPEGDSMIFVGQLNRVYLIFQEWLFQKIRQNEVCEQIFRRMWSLSQVLSDLISVERNVYFS